MKNPYELTALYRKDDVPEVLTARQMSISDFDPYPIMIDLEEIASVESSLVDEKQISLVAMRNGFIHNIKKPYVEMRQLILSQCANYSELVNLKLKQ